MAYIVLCVSRKLATRISTNPLRILRAPRGVCVCVCWPLVVSLPKILLVNLLGTRFGMYVDMALSPLIFHLLFLALALAIFGVRVALYALVRG